MEKEFTILKCSDIIDLEKIIKENFFELKNLITENQKVISQTKTVLSDIIKETRYHSKISDHYKKNYDQFILGFVLGLVLSIILQKI